MKYCLAIDIGASSGRHIVGYIKDGEVIGDEVYRFYNRTDSLNGHLVWNTERLLTEVKAGIRTAFEKYPSLSSLSIDTWGVDYVLMKGDKEVLPVYAYRDSRTEESINEVHSVISFNELYQRTGIQFNSFNTIYQLYADKLSGRLSGVTDFLMLPEYLMYKLTGNKVKEYTNATTTGLVNAESRSFDRTVFERLGLPDKLMKSLYSPGAFVGRLRDEIAKEVGGNLDVVLCATHDTASAVDAIDIPNDVPYISSGTWSLLGVKTEKAITDNRSRDTGYSNEGGVGYNRYQKNITGMWIIQCLRSELCPEMSYSDIAKLAKSSSYAEVFDVNDKAFLSPKSMKNAIKDYFRLQNRPLPKACADYFNSSYVSIADGYRAAIEDLECNTGKTYSKIYIFGGGAKNEYLNAITESRTGKQVHALPIEATAIGNLKIQLKEKR